MDNSNENWSSYLRTYCRFRVLVSNRPPLSWVSVVGEHDWVWAVSAVNDQAGGSARRQDSVWPGWTTDARADCWPSELDLMARLAGVRLRER
jgi:hypothetical protein